MPTRTPTEFAQAATAHKIIDWVVRCCSICNSPLKYTFGPEGVFFHGGCRCSDIDGPERRSWEDIADIYNMQEHPEVIAEFDKFWHFNDPAPAPADSLLSYIQGVVPYLEDAWKACFEGKTEAMLSAEERGMGRLLTEFRRLAAGERVMPLDCITKDEAMKQVEAALEWAHELLGQPNQLKPSLQKWIRAGETCMQGIERADAEVVELRRLLDLAQGELSCSCGIEDASSPCVLCQIESHTCQPAMRTTYPTATPRRSPNAFTKALIMRSLSTTWQTRRSLKEKIGSNAGPFFDQALDDLVQQSQIDFVQQDEGIYRLRSGPPKNTEPK